MDQRRSWIQFINPKAFKDTYRYIDTCVDKQARKKIGESEREREREREREKERVTRWTGALMCLQRTELHWLSPGSCVWCLLMNSFSNPPIPPFPTTTPFPCTFIFLLYETKDHNTNWNQPKHGLIVQLQASTSLFLSPQNQEDEIRPWMKEINARDLVRK